MSLPGNPFPGPVPFKDTDPIFGRGREIAELVDRLVADRLVLLYSPSGAGKSSLLNAEGGVQPQMREREFRTHNTIRVGMEAPAGVNRYVWSCAASLEIQDTAPARLTDILGKPTSDLFVFDQFEEVLTAQPGDEINRLEFFKQLGEAMRVHGRWAVFAIREDYLAPMDEYLEWLPTQLASRMRINILATNEARKAILQPIEAAGTVTFEDGALDAMLLDLAPDGWVEPVQLQVVCKDLWDELGRQKITTITKELLSTSGSAEVALEKYYGNVVRDVAAGEVARKLDVSERSIRDWFGDSLISDSSTRLQVIKGDTNTGTLPTKVVNELERAHLVRSDTRRATWCELTHDRMIRPVILNNIAWKSVNLSLLQRETELWVKSGSSPDHLLRGKSLRKAAKWARQHPTEVNSKEKDYLDRSKRARRKRIALIAGVVAILAVITDAYLEAEAAQLANHFQVVHGLAQEAVQSAAVEPTDATLMALEAEQSHSEGWGFVARLFDRVLGDGYMVREETEARGALLAATVQHDPRFVGSIPYTHHLQDRLCAWYSPDGSTIWAYVFVKEATAASKKPRGTTQAQPFDANTLAPSGAALAAGTGCPTQGFDQPGRVHFTGPAGWSVFKQPDKIEFDAPKGHSPSAYVGFPASSLMAATVDPTARRAAWVTGKDNYVYVMDLGSRQVTSLPAGDLHATAIQFSPDGNILAAGGTDYLVRLWWFHTSGEIWKAPTADIPLRGHTDTVMSLGFSPDGRRLVSQSLDRRIVVWRILPELAPGAGSFPEAFVPGVRLASTDVDRKLTIRSLTGGNADSAPARTFDLGDVSDVFIRRDGRAAAVVTGGDRSSWQVVDLETGRSTGPSVPQTQVINVALSDDGKLAAFCTAGGEVKIYSLDQGKQRFEYDLGKAWNEIETRQGHPPEEPLSVRSVAFLPDGRTLVTGTTFHSILFWSLEHRGEVTGDVQLHNTPTALAIAPDGNLGASLDEMNTVRFWNVQSGDIVGGTLQLPGSSRSFAVNRDLTVQLPGNPRGIAFGADSKSFYALLAGGHTLSWNIDMARMHVEACRQLPMAEMRAEYCGGQRPQRKGTSK